jgi:hypothetical protein
VDLAFHLHMSVFHPSTVAFHHVQEAQLAPRGSRKDLRLAVHRAFLQARTATPILNLPKGHQARAIRTR